MRRYRDFYDFQDGGSRHLEFSKIRNCNDQSAVRGPMCVTLPNFIKIGHTFAEIWQFNGFFSKWRPSAILDLLGAYWDHLNDDHLVVSIATPNFVKTDAVVSIT